MAKERDRLTETEYQIKSYYQHYQKVHGYPPTKAEAANGLGFKSANSIQEALPRMARKGYLQLTANVSRGVKWLEE